LPKKQDSSGSRFVEKRQIHICEMVGAIRTEFDTQIKDVIPVHARSAFLLPVKFSTETATTFTFC